MTNYDEAEMSCAFNGSRLLAIKDRATFEFIRAFAIANKIGDIFLGMNFTTGDPNNPIVYSDGTPFSKDTSYAFDDEKEKFGTKNCTYLKKGISYKPRSTSCNVEMEHICQWNSKYNIRYDTIYYEHLQNQPVLLISFFTLAKQMDALAIVALLTRLQTFWIIS